MIVPGIVTLTRFSSVAVGVTVSVAVIVLVTIIVICVFTTAKPRSKPISGKKSYRCRLTFVHVE